METANPVKNVENKGKKGDFSFSEAAKLVLAQFSERSRDIIAKRYGLTDGQESTLEEIGEHFDVTRERVRQIIKEVIKKSKEKLGDAESNEALRRISLAVKGKSGIISQEELVSGLSGNDAREKSAVRFFIDLSKEIEPQRIPGEMVSSLAAVGFDLEEWKKVDQAAKLVLEKEKQLLEAEGLIKKIGFGPEVIGKKIIDFLSVSEAVKKNQFGKWGLADWEEVSPKGTREKSFLVLKESGKPLHFREIAKLIDRYNLSKRPTNPQTVHNELIKDERFVLVGRGIYALKEWGYQEGTVKDILESILRENLVPMRRDAILERIMEMRQVKKSTVVINLNNFFSRVGKDEYTIKK